VLTPNTQSKPETVRNGGTASEKRRSGDGGISCAPCPFVEFLGWGYPWRGVRGRTQLVLRRDAALYRVQERHSRHLAEILPCAQIKGVVVIG